MAKTQTAGEPRAGAVATLEHLPKLPVGEQRPAPFAPACALFRRHLRGSGLKFTPERAAVLDAVLNRGGSAGLFHADAVVDDLRAAGVRGSRATVYRTLHHLQEAGLLRQVSFDGARQGYYELVAGGLDAGGPRDYLVDAETGEVFPVPDQGSDSPAARLREARDAACRAMGFEPVRHQFHVFARRKRRPLRKGQKVTD
jgi:Fur family ferric uptake transcriptional regulator